ncbi:MAG: DUF2442 domain-containing protein [Candidatus Lambdaproteobacteria bacterium]|nr:DUF2442 domain-containing protein [Candidatus Lambdaproteobacteria bacterium]
MHKIIAATPLEGYTLRIEFDDGLTGEVCLADRLFGPMFAPLKDPTFFARVAVDEYGAVCWPNGADLAPDALHRQIAQQRQDRI